MKHFLNRAGSRISLSGAAALLVIATLLGQFLGLLRTKLVNANFDALGPQSTDAYFAAFKIPDFFFLTLAAGALGVAFMPYLSDRLQRGDRKGMWELSNSLLNLLAIVMGIVAIIILLFAEPLIHVIVAPNMTPEQLANAATIMRLIALNPLLFTISAIFTSAQQTFGRFFFYALAPLIYNMTIIASIFIFKDNLGIVGLGFGALFGAVLQLIVAGMGLIGLNFNYRAVIRWSSRDFRQILRQLPPRSVDQGIDSINSIVETNLARRLGEGVLSYYENAFVLHTAPSLLIGTAISTAAFPRLNERLSQGRTDLFRKDFLSVLRVMVWLVLPVVVVCYFAREYLARLIFAKNAPEIALIFGFFIAAIFFRTIYTLFSRWFYSYKDTKTPLYVSLFAISLNVILAYTLSRPAPVGYGMAGLALAQSIVAASEVLILGLVMVIRDRELFDKNFWSAMLKILSITGFSIFTAFVMVSLIPLGSTDRGFITIGGKLSSIALLTFIVHFGMSYVFGLEETKPVIAKVKDLILRPVKI